MVTYKVWFYIGHPQSAQWEFAIEFRTNQNTQQEDGPSIDVWDAAKILSDKLNVYMTGVIEELE